MIRNLVDLGIFERKYLRIQQIPDEPLKILQAEAIVSPENLEELNTQTYLEGLQSQLPLLKSQWSLGSTPVECLLPGSFFEYSLVGHKPEGTLETFLDSSLAASLNKSLEHEGIEASFLGSGLTAVIESLIRKAKKSKSQDWILLVITYSCTYRVLIQSGKILDFQSSIECSARNLDKLFSSKWKVGLNQVPSLKDDELILLPVFRQEQSDVEGFVHLKPYFEALCTFIHADLPILENPEGSPGWEILLSDGGAALRNLSSFLEGALGIPTRNLDHSFFAIPLENPGESSDLSIRFNPLLCHSSL